jgi:hypothetical protein
MLSRLPWTALSGMMVALLVGCTNLGRFQPGPGETYCGSMVSAPIFHDGLLPEGVPPTLTLRLDLDVTRLDTEPGRLSSGDGSYGLCQPQPLFSRSSLRAIKPLEHDPLSMLEFGEGRDANVLAWVDSSCQATMLAVLSFMRDQSLELRLLKPKAQPPPQAPPADRPGFGLFNLRLTAEGQCGTP